MSFPRAGACFGVRCLCLPGRFAGKSSVLNREEFQCRTPTRARRLEAARLELRWAGLVPFDDTFELQVEKSAKPPGNKWKGKHSGRE